MSGAASGARPECFSLTALRLLAEEIAEPVCLLDRSGAIQYANRALGGVLGRPPDSLVGERLLHLMPQVGADFTDGVREVFNGTRYTGQIRLGGGEPLPTHYRLMPCEDDVGGVWSVLCVLPHRPGPPAAPEAAPAAAAEASPAEDHVDAALRKRWERAEDDLQTFVYIASHDLQEPLRTVSACAAMIEKRSADALDERSRQFLQFVTDAALRMSGLINGLLQFSRVGTDRQPAEAVDMGAVAALAIDDLAETIRQRGAQVTVDPLPVAYGQPELLRLALRHLLENGLKFSPDAPRIHLGGSTRGAWCDFHVRDHGIGIEPAYHERIFGIFKRLHGRSHYPGSGAGLAIVRRIVERHGGTITVESRGDGTGSVFHFTLPAPPAAAGQPKES